MSTGTISGHSNQLFAHNVTSVFLESTAGYVSKTQQQLAFRIICVQNEYH